MTSRDVDLESVRATYRYIALEPCGPASLGNGHADRNDNRVTDKLNNRSQLPILCVDTKVCARASCKR